MDERLTLFIAVTAAAVVLQMLILLGMYIAVRKLSARMEALADRVEDTTVPCRYECYPSSTTSKPYSRT
jgi:hypothetical protein